MRRGVRVRLEAQAQGELWFQPNEATFPDGAEGPAFLERRRHCPLPPETFTPEPWEGEGPKEDRAP